MATENWKVLLHETSADPRGPAKLIEQFSVTGKNIDDAKRLVRAAIAQRGRSVRSVNVSVDQVRTFIAYATPKA